MAISFELRDDSDGAIRDRLLHLLIDENTRRVGEAHIDRSIICIKDDDSEEIQGGIWTELLFDWTYIEILFVSERLRGQGLASQLPSFSSKRKQLPFQKDLWECGWKPSISKPPIST
ncbi:GNAT family N-acetyltransferase [Ochrobactrum quorumnocens]|uniref:Uncharacterized protein n=1 Tax=Ochrobactrum quorumnocens TaxID=271865 RepID=A0A5N1JZ15_9HYPH|nr:GNAT family N-acetyltransferase [[Ochrobactrum] quorumnocens]KAA9367264.1 hypothetical protein F3W84_14165 [[Ochrobactrum] quorumnocens]